MYKMLILLLAIGILATQNFTANAENEPTLEELRQESLLNGKIFDRYLIPYEISPVRIEYFGGIEQANWSYNHLNDLLNLDDDINTVNGRALLLSNFSTLTETQGSFGKVSALLIQEKMKNEIYQPPDIEPLQRLHEHLMKEYPDTGNSDEILTELLGEMRILAPEVLDIVERKTLFGYAPTELVLEDRKYWSALRDYGDCVFVEKNDSCDKYLELANNFKENYNSLDKQRLPITPEVYSPNRILCSSVYGGLY